jgi:hypothetical protein
VKYENITSLEEEIKKPFEINCVWSEVEGFTLYYVSEVGAGAFLALPHSRARSEKRERKREEKRARKKAKVPSAKEKSANSRFFLPSTRETRFQNPKLFGRGKTKDLE